MVLAQQMLIAVRDMHSRGVAHNDIKLGNMVVDYDAVKFIDFGLATEQAKFHCYGPMGGTPCYFPPGECSVQSDSLGEPANVRCRDASLQSPP